LVTSLSPRPPLKGRELKRETASPPPKENVKIKKLKNVRGGKLRVERKV